jgi:two-component sensor histidine kinase
MTLQTNHSLWLWRGVWALAILVALGMSVLYTWLPADGATGDLESFTAEGYRVQWLLEAREGGLQAEDVIVRAGGHTVDEWLKGARRGPEWRDGETITYQVMRDGKALTLRIQLAPVPFRAVLTRWAPQLLGAAASFLIGTLVFWKRPRDPAARLLMLFCVALALQYWGDAYNLQFSALPWRWPFWLHVIYEHGMYGIGIASICHLALVFPAPHPLIRRFTRRAPFVLYTSFPLVVMGAMALSPQRYTALVMGSRASWILAIAQMGLAIAANARSVRTTRDPVTRAQMSWILWSSSVGAVVLLPGYVLPMALRGHPLLPHPLMMIMVTFIPASFAVAILRYRLFDIEIIINRSLVYATLTALLSGLYLLLVRLLTSSVWKIFRRENDTLVVFVATLSIALAFAPLRGRVQILIDRTFYRAKPDYQRMLSEMSEKLTSSIVLDQLVSLLTEKLPRQLQIKWATLAILDSTGEFFVHVNDASHPRLPANHPLNERLHRGRPLLRLQLPAHLPADARAFLEQHGVELSIPLIAGAKLVGWYNLGPKLSGTPYNHEDVRFLQLLGQQAAVAVENSRLFQQAQQEISERRRVEEALRGSVAELENLQQITETLLSLEELPQVMRAISQGIVSRLGYDMVLVSRYLEEEQMFAGLAFAPTPSPERLDQILNLAGRPELKDAPAKFKVPYRRGQNPFIDRVLDGEIVVDDSLSNFLHPWVPRLAAKAVQKLMRMQVFVDLPMQVKGKTAGTIVAGVRRASITTEQQQALIRVAAQAAVAIENARLYEQAQREIAERTRVEEQITASLWEKEVLLKEIHHRVKNNLQIISSLLSLQAHRVEDSQALEIFQESQDRIRSMALIHEKLYQAHDLARINFGEYIHSLSAYLSQAYSASTRAIALQIQADSISLAVDTAIPCGLMLNELISNALKHAFPHDGPGQVRIELGTGPNHHYTLKVSDNGVGMPPDLDLSTTDSFGLQLVNALVNQLGGAIELDKGKGTEFKITFTAS